MLKTCFRADCATKYLELDVLSGIGFVSKREARNTYYRLAKVSMQGRC